MVKINKIKQVIIILLLTISTVACSGRSPESAINKYIAELKKDNFIYSRLEYEISNVEIIGDNATVDIIIKQVKLYDIISNLSEETYEKAETTESKTRVSLEYQNGNWEIKKDNIEFQSALLGGAIDLDVVDIK